MKGVFGVTNRNGCDHGTKVYRGPGTAPPWPGPTKIPGAITVRPGPEFVALATAGAKNFIRGTGHARAGPQKKSPWARPWRPRLL